MPMIKVDLHKGRSSDQKREFVSVITREAARILKCAPEDIDIVFQEVDTQDWAKGGVLNSDRPA
jgi:4-oxalocrotonate tautomerase